MKVFIILLVLFTFNTGIAALNNIEIIGNTKTSENVILDELELEIGKEYSEEQVKTAISKLQNLRIFTDIVYEHSSDKLRISLKEKWTTIPIIQFSSGGGVSQSFLGIYDVNIFGKLYEAGARYGKLEDTNSYVFWFKNPRLFGTKNGFQIQYWDFTRVRVKYDQTNDSKIIKNGFLHKRRKINLAYIKELNPKAKIYLQYNLHQDEFTNELEVEGLNKFTVSLPTDTNFHIPGVSLQLGKLYHQAYLLEGRQFDVDLNYGFSEGHEQRDFFQQDLRFKYYKILFKDHNFALRAESGATNTQTLQYWNYFGGLDKIRGFTDNRFTGRYYWLTNLEYRLPLYHGKSFVIQGNVFLDAVGASERIGSLAKLSGASTGPGLRLIIPKIYGFVMRLDYATYLKRKDTEKISIGVQQFF